MLGLAHMLGETPALDARPSKFVPLTLIPSAPKWGLPGGGPLS